MISAPATRGEYMAEQQIAPGTKLQVAFDVPMGQKTDFNMLATYKEDLDEAYFLMSAPMLAGKPLLMDENQKLLLQYKVGEETFVLAGYPEAVEKKGIRTYWKMRKVAEQRSFVKRRDERFKVAMRLTYQRDNAPTPEPEDAMTIDVSAGGLAVYLNDYPRRGRGPGRTNAHDPPAGRAPRAARAAGHRVLGAPRAQGQPVSQRLRPAVPLRRRHGARVRQRIRRLHPHQI